MPAERFYISTLFSEGAPIAVEEDEFHHLVRVMRGKVGDTVELINGKGQLAQCTITEINKRNATLQIDSLINEPKPLFEVILAQAIPRGNRLDFILEKGTELGMTQLWLFPGDRSERHDFSEKQLARAQTIMAAALKQCGRLWMPDLYFKEPIKKWGSLPYPTYFGDVAPDAPLLLQKINRTKNGVIIIIGPESGLTDAEETKLKSLNATGIKLHTHILRTDTAALAALSLITHI